MNQNPKTWINKKWKYGSYEPVTICRTWCTLPKPSEPFKNKLCENCKETSRITIPGAKALDHPNRTIREKFCSRAVEKRTPAENLIKFKVGKNFLKIRFREKVGGFKIVYKVFKKIFKVDCSNLSSRFFIAF